MLFGEMHKRNRVYIINILEIRGCFQKLLSEFLVGIDAFAEDCTSDKCNKIVCTTITC